VRWWATIGLALAALRQNRMRSLLTTLGIVIGVAAVVMMQSMGEGASAYVSDAISGLGTSGLVCSSWVESRTNPGMRRTRW